LKRPINRTKSIKNGKNSPIGFKILKNLISFTKDLFTSRTYVITRLLPQLSTDIYESRLSKVEDNEGLHELKTGRFILFKQFGLNSFLIVTLSKQTQQGRRSKRSDWTVCIQLHITRLEVFILNQQKARSFGIKCVSSVV